MAVMKKKGNKGLPPISTASLPDVIFMILFFFMVSTTMRDQELLVRYKLPEATEVQKLEKKSLVSYIHIGQPSLAMQAKFGTAPRIQLNDSYKTAKDILDFCAAERDKLNESDRALMTICLKADGTTKMGIITDVKQELRKANALKISYAASKSLGDSDFSSALSQRTPKWGPLFFFGTAYFIAAYLIIYSGIFGPRSGSRR